MRFFYAVSIVSAAAMFLGCNENSGSRPDKSSQLPSSPVAKAADKIDERPIITVSPKAVMAINQILAGQPLTEKIFLRIRVVPGGCQGFMHKLDLDQDVSTEDQLCESAGVTVVVFKRQVEMLRGAEVDFGEVDGNQGFKLENPNFKGEAAKKWLAILEKEKDIR